MTKLYMIITCVYKINKCILYKNESLRDDLWAKVTEIISTYTFLPRLDSWRPSTIWWTSNTENNGKNKSYDTEWSEIQVTVPFSCLAQKCLWSFWNIKCNNGSGCHKPFKILITNNRWVKFFLKTMFFIKSFVHLITWGCKYRMPMAAE